MGNHCARACAGLRAEYGGCLMADFSLDARALDRFVNDLDGGVAKELRRQAEALVIETKHHLEQDRVDEKDPRAHQPNPNTTRPRMRSGKLRDSICTTETAIDDGVVTVGVGYDPDTDGGKYAPVLLGREESNARNQRVYQLAPDRIANL